MRVISIRWSLFHTFVLVVALITGAILFANDWFGARAVTALAQRSIERATAHADSDLAAFLEPVDADLEVLRQWAAAGRFNPDDTEATNVLVAPLMAVNPQIGILTTGDAAGAHMLLRREGEYWFNREMRPDAPGVARVARWQRLNEPAAWVTRSENFDHRERPWFKNTIGQPTGAPVYWTKPYMAHDSKRPIMTAALRVDRPKGEPFVVALHVFVERISAFTTSLAPSPNGQAFVLDDSGRMLGLPRDARFASEAGRNAALLKRPRDLEMPALAAAVERWKEAARAEEPFTFELDGQTWWSGFRQVALNDRRSLWIGTLVPEADFSDAVRAQQAAVVSIGVVVLLVALVLAFFISRAYSTALARLVDESERIQRLDLTPPPPLETRLREISQLAQAHERMRLALDAFSRYVPTGVVRELLRRGEAARIDGREEVLTVFFSDIRGFTTISESLEPSALTQQMAEYFEAMLEVLQSEGATIDKFIGDAIMAFWGAPVPDPEHARHAVSAALRCQQRLVELNAAWQAQGRPALPTRIGLATGPVVVGNVGAPTRLNYTLLGDTANLASRLEGTNRVYGTDVLVSAAVRDAAGPGFIWREVDAVAVKGKSEVIHIFEPIAFEGQGSERRLAYVRAWGEALHAYRGRAFADALIQLEALSAAHGDDPSIEHLRRWATQFARNPPPADWDGATVLSEK